MSGYERKGYVVGVLGLAVGIGGLVIAKLSIDAGWRIAEASGSLDKSEYSVGIGEWELPGTGPAQILVGAQHVRETAVPVIGAIPFKFFSKGKKTVESLTITFQYPEMMKRSVLELMEPKKSGDFGATEIARSFTENAKQSFVSYRIPALNPGVSIGIQEPAFLRETTLRLEAPVTTKDGVNLTLPITTEYSLTYSMSVNAKDSAQRIYPLRLAVKETKSMKELQEEPAAAFVKSERIKIRRSLNFWQYLAALLTSDKSGQIFLIYVPTEEMVGGGAKVFAAKGTPQVSLAEYPLLDWSLLRSRQ